MQFACLGVAWPPTAGWRKRLIGTFITDEQAERFEAAKFVLASQTIKRHKRQEAELLRVMGREIPPELLPVETQKSEKAKRKADKRARKAELRRAKEQALHCPSLFQAAAPRLCRLSAACPLWNAQHRAIPD